MKHYIRYKEHAQLHGFSNLLKFHYLCTFAGFRSFQRAAEPGSHMGLGKQGNLIGEKFVKNHIQLQFASPFRFEQIQ